MWSGPLHFLLAKRAGFVSAVEAYGPAVEICAASMRLAKLDNVDGKSGDAGEEFPDTDADVIIVDPPRTRTCS